MWKAETTSQTWSNEEARDKGERQNPSRRKRCFIDQKPLAWRCISFEGNASREAGYLNKKKLLRQETLMIINEIQRLTRKCRSFDLLQRLVNYIGKDDNADPRNCRHSPNKRTGESDT